MMTKSNDGGTERLSGQLKTLREQASEPGGGLGGVRAVLLLCRGSVNSQHVYTDFLAGS